ncbi:MAG TPA: phenylalanine--tRNA ligase subunit beta [Roseiflexaceae bacterium]|nr:phenylalanine--tRNA ligase subunit beta [Roseiflexaceae bacterium]
MRVPLSWLREFVDIPMPPAELAERLTRAGLEVEEVEYIGVEGANLPWDPAKVLVANILEVRPHPNADRLVLADVDYGAAEPHTVVTGAPNLFPYKGRGRLPHPLKGVFAREGAELYDGHAEGRVKMVLKGRPVRGVMSNAMLCSEKELGLSEEHEGILLLPDDAPVGAPLRDYLGDVVIVIDVLPNMSRALSILGVAREVAALTGGRLRMPEIRLDASGPPIEGRAAVTVEEPDLCPRFTATLIEGVEVKPSPLWMQRRLTMAGMRPINNIVDVSNYVMLELGQPNHTFDADEVHEQHLVVRLARPGERLTTLDGREHDLSQVLGGATPPLLVCDPRGPLSLAGVMGGASSEVSERTTRVLLEAAVWEPTIIRRMSTALKARSEASRRFERGVDLELPPLAQRRALSLLQQVAGGTVAAGMLDAYPRPWQPLVLDLTPREVRRILGIDLTAQAIADLLRPLGFTCELVEGADGQAVRVTVPSYRRDVQHTADLCEEVARMYGYDRIPTTMMADELPEQRANPAQEREQQVRDLLTGAGLDEAITYSLTNMADVARVNPAEADPALFLRLANPLTAEREYLRRSLLTTLLEALSQNLRERERVLLFEIGRVYLRRAGSGQTGAAQLPEEPRRLAIAMAGAREPLSWLAPRAEPMDFFDLKGVVETLLARLNAAERVRFAPLTGDPRFHPGRAAELLLRAEGGEVSAGVLGELHPDVRERLEITAPRALAAELDLDVLIETAQPARFRPISRYPATVQDLSFVVGMDVPAAQVEAAIRKYAGPLLERVTLFDVFEGEALGAGRRSLTYRLTFRAPDRTLSDAELSKVRQKIIRGLEHDVQAVVRA